MTENESDRVRKVYEKRKTKGWEGRYRWYRKDVILTVQERERVLLSMLKNTLGDMSDKRILDIG